MEATYLRDVASEPTDCEPAMQVEIRLGISSDQYELLGDIKLMRHTACYCEKILKATQGDDIARARDMVADACASLARALRN